MPSHDADSSALARQAPLFLRPLTVVLYLVILAGQFSLSRAGYTEIFPVPVRLVAMCIVTFFVVVLASANCFRSKAPRHATFVVLPLFYFLLTGLWGGGSENYWSLVTDIVCLILISFCVYILLWWDRPTFETGMMWSMFVSGLVFSLAGLLSASTSARMSAFGGGPNVYSRITMMGFIGLVGLVVLRKLPVAAAAIAPIFLVATVLSGSRGGMLAGIAAICFLLPIFGHLKKKHIVGILSVLTVCAIAVYHRYSDALYSTVDTRVIELTIDQHYSSGRTYLVAAAWNMFTQRPIGGWGLGGFADYFGGGFNYPHNILLQAACEGGLFGILALLCSIFLFLWSAGRGRHDPHRVVFVAAAALILVESMFSGGYYDVRFFWVFALLSLPAPAGRMASRDTLNLRSYRRVAGHG